ncbi:interactor of constitutive active ROPs 1-like [Raphanus sativus]|uniref:Interactor of constitutive active ROPs 1-like n=1 Tax=Raphanus sativus TaxID=3726 RepID=A0A9W3C4W7_RAPSA|nr:interactor of constitutive active ROPs 1-like [Raphanus sativus]
MLQMMMQTRETSQSQEIYKKTWDASGEQRLVVSFQGAKEVMIITKDYLQLRHSSQYIYYILYVLCLNLKIIYAFVSFSIQIITTCDTDTRWSKENEILKSQLNDSASEMSKVKANEDEMASNVCRIGEELEESREEKAQIKEKLEFMGETKEALEAEMKTLGVQTEQWRKAADAAAAVLSGECEMNGRDGSRSLDKSL